MTQLTSHQIESILASDGFPVVKIISRDREGIDYEVVCGDPSAGDMGNARSIWSRRVEFSESVHAASYAFVEAAQEHEQVANLVLAVLLDHGR